MVRRERDAIRNAGFRLTAIAAVLMIAACSGAPSTTPEATLPAASASAPSPSGTTPTVEPTLASTPAPSGVTSRCPPPATINVLGGWSPEWPLADVVACARSGELTVVGYLAPAWGIGGTNNGLVPAWLGEWFGLPSVLWLRPHPAAECVAPDDCLWMFIFAPDATTLPLAPDRWVTVTGHFNDPASTTCHWVGPSGDPRTAAEAVAVCRQHFVVTGIADAPTPSPLP